MKVFKEEGFGTKNNPKTMDSILKFVWLISLHRVYFNKKIKIKIGQMLAPSECK